MKPDLKKTMQSLRASHAKGGVEAGPSKRLRSSYSEKTDMKTVSAYQEFRLARMAADAMGIVSPFFRQIEAVDGVRIRIGDKWCENFASYDYLSLNRGGAVAEAAANASREWGVSATASRLVGGEFAFHAKLEDKLAGFVGTEAALVMVSGHATNHAILRTMLGPGDLVLVDALAHNSVFEGVRSSGAAHMSFPHNDDAWIDAKLEDVRDQYNRVLIVTEGLYSMDGDMPDLRRFVEIKERHDAWLMVDEAHSIGVLGATGRGICEEQGIDPGRVDIIMGTLSKSLCSCGGFVAGSQDLIDILKFAAPGFVFSVGLSVPNSAAAIAAVEAIEAEPERVQRLKELGKLFLAETRKAGLDAGLSQGVAVAPIIIGDSFRATWVSNKLLEDGYNVLPIIAPAVPNQSARLRFFLNADHSPDVIRAVIRATAARAAEAKTLKF